VAELSGGHPSHDDVGERSGRPTFVATATTTFVAVPLFFVSGLAVQIGSDLHLDPRSLGLAVSTYFAATALSTATLGRVVQRVGARRGLIAAIVVSSLVLLGIAVAGSVLHIAVLLAVGGLANGTVHPASNALLAGDGSRRGLGRALGIKQAAPAFATLVAGLAVPLVALTLGWRWSFAGAGVLGLLLLWSVWSVPAPAVSTPDPPAAAGPTVAASLLPLAIAAGLGSAAGNSVAVFLVDSGVRMTGLAEGSAGVVYAAASLAGIVARIGFGWLVDSPRGPHPLVLASWLLASGAVGHLLMATGSPPLFVLGGIVGFGLGWGWPGLVQLAAVRHRPGAAARATGTVMTGFATGSLLGPLVFGQLVHREGYPALWLATTCLCVASSLLLLVLRRRF
jgi:MFS family permease